MISFVHIGLCAGITYAEDAMVVDSAMTTLRIQKKRTDDLAGELVPVTCLNCTASQTALVSDVLSWITRKDGERSWSLHC